MQTSSLKPLSGMKILVTRAEAQNVPISEKLRGLGATPIELPTIAIVPPENTEVLEQSITRISEYDWVIFTSVHGVRFFSELMTALGVPWDKLGTVNVAAIGSATADALERAGKKPDYVPAEYLSEKIVLGLGDVKGKRILLPRADIASKKLPGLLREREAIVEEAVAYRTVTPEGLSSSGLKSILSQGIDVLTFTSPSTVRNLVKVVGTDELQGLLRNVKIACIGPVTAEAAEELGLCVDIVARTHTVDALVEAIENEVRTV
jgi:uroporphyrinogen III methyltransferase/synthase